jgi:hypothetical protein
MFNIYQGELMLYMNDEDRVYRLNVPLWPTPNGILENPQPNIPDRLDIDDNGKWFSQKLAKIMIEGKDFQIVSMPKN